MYNTQTHTLITKSSFHNTGSILEEEELHQPEIKCEAIGGEKIENMRNIRLFD